MDAAVYYAVIRHLKPHLLIEIGSGYSTRIAQHAIDKNCADGSDAKVVCIEPFPQPRFLDANLDVQLIQQKVEAVDVGLFQELEADDILFIDSSHVAKFHSDVLFEVLEILPTLRPGVWIHVHDIFFPHDYPPEWLIERRIAFNEQYFLEAFLSYNETFKVQLANYWLKLDFADSVGKLWRSTTSDRCIGCGSASLWIRKS